MTREDIIRMAREAFGAPYSSYLEKRNWDISDKQVERFAALVAAAERERICQLLGVLPITNDDLRLIRDVIRGEGAQ